MIEKLNKTRLLNGLIAVMLAIALIVPAVSFRARPRRLPNERPQDR